MARDLTPEIEPLLEGLPTRTFRGCTTYTNDLSQADFVVLRVKSREEPTVHLLGFKGSPEEVARSVMELRPRPRR